MHASLKAMRTAGASLLVLLTVTLAMLASGTALAKAEKIDICHRTGNGGFIIINVSVNAAAAHFKSGGIGHEDPEEWVDLGTGKCEPLQAPPEPEQPQELCLTGVLPNNQFVFAFIDYFESDGEIVAAGGNVEVDGFVDPAGDIFQEGLLIDVTIGANTEAQGTSTAVTNLGVEFALTDLFIDNIQVNPTTVLVGDRTLLCSI